MYTSIVPVMAGVITQKQYLKFRAARALSYTCEEHDSKVGVPVVLTIPLVGDVVMLAEHHSPYVWSPLSISVRLCSR